MPFPSDKVVSDALPVRLNVTLGTDIGVGLEQYETWPLITTKAGGVGVPHEQGVPDAVGVGVGVSVGVAVGLGVSVGVAVGVEVALGLGVGVVGVRTKLKLALLVLPPWPPPSPPCAVAWTSTEKV